MQVIIWPLNQIREGLPEDGIYVREAFLRAHPDVCEKFIRASFEGWQYAFAHREETVKYITDMASRTEFKTTEKNSRSCRMRLNV
ncbi:hypothetical protein DENIS_1408 [Desulfonema ishimotonii]|uniref:SsuA/THI5-like domain-containing protein n=1 Tax=Desulfonema ishimotonii TaxID=45657 RepID=A0A401FU25_9BACT|nr:ABC transporter substrate-binding protein [Desulfonema ishimotonii]GBC60455.1 hypothetical protein DENIS_1408 [Desulfonema ishimotonii]